MYQNDIITIIGPIASGKTTLAKEFESHGWTRRLEVTTRPIRPNEKDGEDLVFVTDDEFSLLERDNYFLETVAYITKGNGGGVWRYGFPDLTHTEQNTVIVTNPLTLHKIFLKGTDVSNWSIVFLDPPMEAYMKRAIERGDDPEEVGRRVVEDYKIFEVFRKTILEWPIKYFFHYETLISAEEILYSMPKYF